ncbi:uncharacterized protein LOC130778616 [Actinidia eriantha]|uniref:uncharacterized protein LOC130778616 n=1 Tax=Actinidia eriantha TaxID=165200 RepID=UPI00258997D5|nr:uncharacterized protein LOC130778616 [Actinidia eriantha]
MPSFAKIAWESLLEPGVLYANQNSNDSHKKSVNDANRAQTSNHIYISPALYVTPAATPIPEALSDPPSPSPYVVNHKRRGGGRFDEIPPVKAEDGESGSNSSGDGENGGEEVLNDELFGVYIGGNGGSVAEDDGDDYNPGSEAVSVVSSADDLGKHVECRSFVSNQGEFFDADEDFSSDGSISNISSSFGQRMLELGATRLSLLEEIERRKSAENVCSQICGHWQRLANLMSESGLTLPGPPNGTSMQLENDSLEQLCQELEVCRFVAETIGRGQARAEVEKAAEAIIESKDQEISRLRDRLQYCEAVNREMSQRNQEIMEVARMQQQREKKQQWRWIWSCVGVSVAVGASLIVYSYLPETSKHYSLPSSSDSSDAS